MKKHNYISLFAAVALLAGIVLQVLPVNKASAAQITLRRLTLQAGVSDGGSKPGGTVNHYFEFTVPTGGSVGSIQFQYCTTAASVAGGIDCNDPGTVTTGATMGSQSGATGFTLNNTVNNAPYLTRTAAAITGGTPLSYQLLGVQNPPTANQTFFVRISTFTSTDATGSPLDTGTVNASTATPIVLSGTMPESLVFCTGATISTTVGVPDCSTATSGVISFNQLFSPTDTATATSQMAASTNAGAGYAITVNGPTLTSGSNTITAMAGGLGTHGISQFGLNLKANTVATAASFPGTSAEVAPAANGTNYRGQASPSYDTVDNFTFASGDAVAKSDNGGAGGTDAQIFTSSYIVNVPGSQPAGTYTATLTYICTPTF